LVYPIVEQIIVDKAYQKHPFKLKWRHLQGKSNRTPLIRHSSWQNVKLLLEIEDITQYREFIMTCPTIEQFLIMKSKSKGTVEFGIYESEDHSVDLTQDKETILVKTQEEKISDDDSLQEILMLIIPILTDYAVHHDDEYADMCDEWFTNGLSENTTMEKLKEICQITSIDDFYMLLKLSPALQDTIDIAKNGECITVTRKPTKNLQCIESDKLSEEQDIEMIPVLSNSDWVSLHKHVYQIVTKWADTQKTNHLAMAWRTAV
jgi:hypothetical protein